MLPFFIEYLFSSQRTDKEPSKIISSSARMDGLLNIGKDSFLNISINIPALAEQIAIGNFFSQLDDTIAFCQRELEKYKKLKEGYLQKMFV